MDNRRFEEYDSRDYRAQNAYRGNSRYDAETDRYRENTEYQERRRPADPYARERYRDGNGYPVRSGNGGQNRQTQTDRYYDRSEQRDAYANRTRSGGTGRGGSGSSGGGKKRRKKRRLRPKPILIVLIAVLVLLILGILALVLLKPSGTTAPEEETQAEKQPGGLAALFTTPSPTPSPTPEPTPTPTPTPKFDIPHAVDSTKPENWGYESAVEVNGTQVDSYQRETPIVFGTGEEYTEMEGIVTFRGNNYREGAAYGTATVVDKLLKKVWEVETGEIMRGSGYSYKGTWTGSVWTGQPLAVKWPESTKKIMKTMYDSAKQDPDLVEVIYATVSGDVYFLNLKTGEKTRDILKLNMPFKGAGALDPRGYPILYLGSGDMYDDYPEMQTRAMAVSLVDGSVLYEFGKAYDPFAIRKWHAYDSSPLVSAETDTLIYPGENGIIYTIKLNTEYDEAAGTLTMHPGEVAKYRYNSTRSTTESNEGVDMYWLGFESSVTIWGEYMYLASNDGYVQCININTLEPVWIQDVGDDANGSLVLEEDEARRTAYLYAGPTLHFTQNQKATGTVPMFKLDAVTGEILWKVEKSVHTTANARGGIQATAILGKGNISDLVIIPFERTYSDSDPDNISLGYTVAINKNTGEIVWEKKTNFAWSSPIAIYDEAGTAYIVQPDSHGNVYLFDGATGDRLCILESGGKNFEASGIAYGNMIVIGNKDKKIFGIKIS